MVYKIKREWKIKKLNEGRGGPASRNGSALIWKFDQPTGHMVAITTPIYFSTLKRSQAIMSLKVVSFAHYTSCIISTGNIVRSMLSIAATHQGESCFEHDLVSTGSRLEHQLSESSSWFSTSTKHVLNMPHCHAQRYVLSWLKQRQLHGFQRMPVR